MRISVSVDASQLILKMEKGQKRLAFGVASAINKTALRVQRAERTKVKRSFTVRQEQFVLRQAAIIKPFANAKQGRPFAEISVGQRPRLLLSIYERGGTRKPFKGRRVAVPITGSAARPEFDDPVPKKLRFTQLRFRKTRPAGFTKSGRVRRKPGGKGIRFGLERTYLVPEVGVFQRGEDGKAELIYAFEPPPRLKRRLGFVVTARRVATRWFGEEMERELIDILRRAGFR